MPFSKRRILVVDDSSINRQLLCRILEKEYITVQAADGAEAWEILQKENGDFSLILLDIVMPKMDGYEFLQRQINHPQFSAIPVIVETAQDSANTEVLALSSGAADFITKPYNPDVIRHRAASIIRLRETAAMLNISEKDSLTNLLNKELFYKRSADMIKRDKSRNYYLAAINIVGFKLINDLFGESFGDRVLISAANALSDIILSTGGLCSRIAADNFACLVPRDSGFETLWENDFSNYMKQSFPGISFDFCCGIYPVDNRSLPVNIMYDRAKLAADEIKGLYDRRTAYYDDILRKKLLAIQEITAGMEEALSRSDFVVYYQPKCRLHSGEIVGAEALVRWLHPLRGFIPPDDFIPIFEHNGFITELDLYVLDEVCQNLRRWMDLEKKIVPISVNLSRVDLYVPNLPEKLLSVISNYNISPKYIHLEITESAYTDDPDQIISVVNKLRGLGFAIEMDDFGSGYSSLNMLGELPIDILKLDMKFLQGRGDGESKRVIISFVVALAKVLGFRVVAEGVETRDEALFLHSLDCELGQGFFFSKPIPMDEFEAMLNAVVCPISDDAFTQMVNNVTIDQIWDPLSQFNVVFNSRVAILSVIELIGDNASLLRGNKRFVRAFGFDPQLISPYADMLKGVVEEDRAPFLSILHNITDIGGECEVCLRFKDYNCPGTVWISVVQCVLLMKAGSHSLFLCSYEKPDIASGLEPQ